MCFCSDEIRRFCGGKRKFLIRFAWTALVSTTLLDICAVVAYWKLAPEAFGSKPGIKLALVHLLSVHLIFTFAASLSIFVIKFFRGNCELMTSSRFGYGPSSYHLHPMQFSDGVRRALPNNTRQSLSSLLGDGQSAPSSTDNRNRNNLPTERPPVNTRQNSRSKEELAQVQVVPKAITESYSDPIYENLKALSSMRTQNASGSRTSASIQESTSNILPEIGANACELAARSRSNLCSCSSDDLQNEPQVVPRNRFDGSNISRPSSAVGEPSRLHPSNANLTGRRIFSRSEGGANRFSANDVDLVRDVNYATIYSDDSPRSDTTDSDISRQYEKQSTTETRKTDSFLANSQPVVNQYRRYFASSLPAPTVSPQSQMLFNAVMRTDHLLEQAINVRKIKAVSKTAPVQV